MESLKQKALSAIKDLPEDVDISEIFDRLYLIYKVQRGLQQAEAGDKVTQEEARERMARWLK